jgi:tetratricopeptide (TPR) repeat protein
VNRGRVVGLLALLGLLTAGCATVQDLTRDLPGVKYVKYKMAGADRAQRASLERGLTHLRDLEYDAAVRALRRATWDVEQIDQQSLRLEELVEVHLALADAYTGLGKNEWSEEQQALAQGLFDLGRRENGSASPEAALARAKAAYQRAQFRQAVTTFGQALVELERLSPTPARLKFLVDARCHLVLAHFALGQSERAGEEVRRLAAREGATVSCARQAPPPVRSLIQSVEASEARLGKRSAD